MCRSSCSSAGFPHQASDRCYHREMRHLRNSFARGIRALTAAGWGLLLTVALASGPVEGQSTSGGFAGRPLAEALLALQSEGLTIVFTSELVRPEMTVVAEPSARNPREILEEILAPHRLEAREGPGDVLVVVASSEGSPGE